MDRFLKDLRAFLAGVIVGLFTVWAVDSPFWCTGALSGGLGGFLAQDWRLITDTGKGIRTKYQASAFSTDQEHRELVLATYKAVLVVMAMFVIDTVPIIATMAAYITWPQVNWLKLFFLFPAALSVTYWMAATILLSIEVLAAPNNTAAAPLENMQAGLLKCQKELHPIRFYTHHLPYYSGKTILWLVKQLARAALCIIRGRCEPQLPAMDK